MVELMKHVIIDVDAGTDDAMGLLVFLYLIQTCFIKIEAIVCTFGNTEREHVVKNVVRLLETRRITDIPVYKGASRPFVALGGPRKQAHGKDGFGDLTYHDEPDLSIVKDTPGAQAIYDRVKKYPNQIDIIVLGPMTTIALAEMMYGDFLSNVKELWVMGGNYKGVGNTVTTGEFNFFTDPEAAHIILGSTQRQVNLLPWETCFEDSIPLKWRLDVLGKSKDPCFQLLTRAEQQIHINHTKWVTCDSRLAASFLAPKEMMLSRKSYCAEVELCGRRTRGQVAINYTCEKPNVNIIERTNLNYFQELLLTVAGIK